jgi:predicted aspartyl protease
MSKVYDAPDGTKTHLLSRAEPKTIAIFLLEHSSSVHVACASILGGGMTMNRNVLFGTGIAMLLSAVGLASEVTIKMKDLPTAVRKTVEEQSKGATLHGLSKEVEGGKTYYEAELKVNGRNKDVLIDATGVVVEIEEEAALDSLPEAARASIEKQAGKRRIVSVESVTKNNNIVAYEAKFQGTGKTSEIKVASDGTLMK